ncbi:TNF receptor-associated factor 4 [Lamellibrachia satsuma]|nr:TNF receptor-associated factor 4 [Lamellibrachia satsuma]
MPGFQYLFADRVHQKLICSLCKLPMREPVKISSCGHVFCDSCLQEFLSEGIFKCPEDQLPLDYAKIFPDPDTEAEVLYNRVHCIHNPEGCHWIDKLCKLQAHLDVCRYDTMPCPNSCAAMLSRICLDDHMQYTCPRRMVTCDFCHCEFTGEAMEHHEGNCGLEVVWCENKCGAKLERRFLNNHMSSECHKRTVPCPHCKKQFVFETLQNHFYRCPRFPVSCPNRCDPTKIPREDIESHVREHCPSVSVPCTFHHAGCKHMCPRFGMDKHLERCMQDHLSLMCQLALSQEQRISELSTQLDLLSQVTDGSMLWKIPNVASRLVCTANEVDTEVLSPPFYTGRCGYRMRASAFLSGNGSGEGTHISLYIHMLTGEYDNLLEWPFRQPISFWLLDQCSDPEKRSHVLESFTPNPSWKHFQRPRKDIQSMGFGYPKFAAQDTLRSGTFIKDDTVFIKIEVDAASFIVP